MDDLRALAVKATPGPWANRGCETPGYRCVALSRRRDEPYTIGPMLPADAAYVQAIDPTTLLALLDERDALLAALPEDPWVWLTRREGHARCYACDTPWSESLTHGLDCRWVAALASARAGAGEEGA